MNIAVAARVVLVGLGLLALWALAGERAVSAAVPAMRELMAVVADEFDVLALGLDHERADRVLRAQVTVARYFVIGERVFAPDARGVANASTLALASLQGPLVALWVALAWPGGGMAVLTRRLAWVLPPAVALAVLDAPVVLAGALWQLAVDVATPGSTSPLLVAKAFLQGGGRLALGAAIGAAAVALAGGRGLTWARTSGDTPVL